MVAQLREPSLFLAGCGERCEARTVLGLGRELAVLHDAETHETYGRQMVTGRPDHIVTTGPLTINLTASTVTLHGETIRLSRTEWLTLSLLAREAGAFVSVSRLGGAILGVDTDDRGDWHTVRVVIVRLRHRLGEYGQMVENHPSIGYRLLMVDEFTPTPRGQWSTLYPCCTRCGKTDRLHDGGGLCTRCRMRRRGRGERP